MSSTVNYSVYGKRYANAQHLFETYANKTSKVGWYEKFDKKVHLASGVLARGGETKFLYKTCIGITTDELLEVASCLKKAAHTPGASNEFCISEGTDYKGDSTKLVLRDSDYQGLVLLRLNAKKADIVVDEDSDEDPDPEPVPVSGGGEDENFEDVVEWSECFEKFYISKRDDWKKFNKVMLAIHNDVTHLNDVDLESVIPPAGEPPQMQKQIVGPSTPSTTTKGGGKRGAGGSGGGARKKSRPTNAELFDGEQQVRPLRPIPPLRSPSSPLRSRSLDNSKTKYNKAQKHSTQVTWAEPISKLIRDKKRSPAEVSVMKLPPKTALATIFQYMLEGSTLEETVLKHLDELNSEAKFDYMQLARDQPRILYAMYDVIKAQVGADE
ncbi:Hypothetical predicted protein [Paramuricea clavata]|uniref:Uncharacterized protein n=1 Tax=Paramuricea clavata TaxID=317549 RepID=A0A7D9J3R8_PARCT|nr:Hypothetical predicted protein [Paramuricea clavata]